MGLQSSLAAFQRSRNSIGGGVSSGLRASMQPHPLFVQEARGAHVWDLDGDRYVDCVMAWGAMVLGHSDDRVVSAVRGVVDRMQVVGTGHVLEYAAAEAVLDAVPHGERLLWSNTGTEAVQVSLRLARAATGRRRIVKFAKSYHGWQDSVYAGMSADEYGRPTLTATKGQSPSVLDDLIVSEFNDVDMITGILEDARELDIAAVLLDPIMSNAGVTEPLPEFLRAVRTLCDEAGVVLIFDEVIAGFRIARGGATERFGVRPDLSVFGKAIAGGFTQSAVVGRADLIDQVTDGVVHAGTFNGNPVALAAVEVTMGVLTDPAVYATLESNAARFNDAFDTVLTDAGVPAHLNRVGSLLQFVPEDAATGLHGTGGIWGKVLGGMLAEGVMFMPSGKIFMSTAHTPDDIDFIAEALSRVVG
ncbi:aminotransferase class III-fold pyridoxal phosphate-dependent enzyme [Rhodococcus sp. USK13]|uniref:aspartate aminotransferase family protein n=1 Tax=Rhodococcus sp. USK13 TaxID=2806442 RepID=UPI001BD04F10|nr:aminotransferase class III-fold pyridoxal phosphate-dependent enzyme [Rhodococcus sp. USK13]